MIGNWLMGIGIAMIVVGTGIDQYRASQFHNACTAKNGYTIHADGHLQCMKKDSIINVE